MNSTRLPFGTRLIGQAEKTLNAILDHLLLGSGVTEREWVALTITVHGGAAPAPDAAERIAGTLKLDAAAGADVLQALVHRGFVGPRDGGELVAVTDVGQQFHEGVQERISSVTDRLWADIPTADRDAAAAVLNTVLERATTELADLRRGAGRAQQPVGPR